MKREVDQGQELKTSTHLVMTEAAISARRELERGIKIIEAHKRLMGLVVGSTTSVTEITGKKE